MKLDPEEVARLAKLTVQAKPAYVKCEDWLHMVGEYAEALQRKENVLTERFQMVREHAKDCPGCHQELELLVELLGEE